MKAKAMNRVVSKVNHTLIFFLYPINPVANNFLPFKAVYILRLVNDFQPKEIERIDEKKIWKISIWKIDI